MPEGREARGQHRLTIEARQHYSNRQNGECANIRGRELRSRSDPVVVATAALMMFVVLLELNTSKLFRASIDPVWFRDFGLLVDQAREMLSSKAYAPGTFFPPSSLMLFASIPPVRMELAFRIFLLVQGASLVGTVWLWSRMLSGSARQHAIIVLLGVSTSWFYVRFDLRMHNANLIYLCLFVWAVASMRRPFGSATAFAASVCLKPYGNVLLFPWMLWHGRWRWCLVSLGAVAILAIGPVIIGYGPLAASALFKKWVAGLASAAASPIPNLSLNGAMAALLDRPIDSVVVGWVVTSAYVAWVGALILYFIPAFRWRNGAGIRQLADLSALVIIALPVGGWQQPARAAAFLLPTLVLAAGLLNDSAPVSRRAVLTGILLLVGMLPWIVPMGPAHAGLTLVLCVLILLGLAIARSGPEPRRLGDTQLPQHARLS